MRVPPWVPITLAFGFAALMLFAGLGAPPLFNPDEGRNAEVAREMQVSGSWLIPTYNGAVYLDKPAFFFRLVASAYSLFGQSEASARLPSALFGLGTAVLLFLFVRRAFGLRAAAMSVVVLATMPLYFVFSRLVIFDSALTFFVVAALFCGFRAEEVPGASRWPWYRLGALAVGMATLVKGPVGFILPAVAMSCFHLYERRFDALRRLFSPWNVLVWLLVSLPWFIAVSIAHPDFPDYGLVHESLGRFTTTAFKRTEPFYYFGPILLVGCLTWAVLLLASARAGWRARARWSRADAFLVVCTIAMILFFSVSQSKRPGYVLPVVVALAALTARICDSALARPAGAAARIVKTSALWMGFLSLAIAGVLGIESAIPGTLARLIKGRTLSSLAGILGSGRLALAFGLAGALMCAGFFFHRVGLALLSMVLFFPLVCLAGVTAVAGEFEGMSARSLSRAIESRAPGVEVACLNCYPNGLAFYLRRTLMLFTADGQELRSNYVLYALGRGAPMTDRLHPIDDVETWIDARHEPVLFLADRRRRDWLERLATARGVETVALDGDWSGALFQPGGGR